MVPKETSNNECAFDSCDRTHYAKGLCSTHYYQRRNGGTLKPIRAYGRGLPVDQRFWEKVSKGNPTTCWEWQAGSYPSGYGAFNALGNKVRAHRFSYELTYGPIPDGLAIDHICRNVRCVNPDHLRLATPKQNAENLQGASHATNPSGHRGVSWNQKRQRWYARVGHMGREYSCGYHSTKEEAAEAARQKRIELFTHNIQDRIKT